MGVARDYIMKVYLTEKEAIKGSYTTLIASMEADDEVVTCTGPHNLEVGDLISFRGTSTTGSANIGTFVKGTVYHVLTVPSSTTFTASSTKGGAPFSIDSDYTWISAGATGYKDAYVVRDNCLQVAGASAEYNLNKIDTKAQIDGGNIQKQEHGKIVTDGFWTHVKYYYRIESNEPAKKFYVDWDDGEDNDPNGKANYSIKEHDVPQNFAVFEHTYTKHGPFFPKLKVTSPEGFESKYYTPSWGRGSANANTNLENPNIIKIDTVADVSDSLDDTWFRIYDGNNQGYHVWINTDATGGQKHTVNIPDDFIEVEHSLTVTGDSADQVATDLTTTFNSLAAFSAAATTGGSDNYLKASNQDYGNSNFPDPGNCGFTFSVDTYGASNDVSSLEDDPVRYDNPNRIVSVDSIIGYSHNVNGLVVNTGPRIPVLCPSNKPPVAVIKADRTEIMAGIDNEVLGTVTNPLVYCYLDGKDFHGYDAATINGSLRRAAEATIANILEVVWQDTNNNIYKDTVGANTQTSQTADYIIGTAGSIYVKKILSVKIKDIREGGDNYQGSSAVANLYPNEKIHLIAHETGTNPDLPETNNDAIDDNTDPTVCSVSLGNPYLSATESNSIVTVDGSESYSPNSNVSIEKYRYDTGKHSQATSVVSAADNTLPSHIFNRRLNTGIGLYADTPLVTREVPTLDISYCFDIGKGEQIDSNHRFYPKEQLIRLQVEDSSNNTRMDDTDAMKWSILEVDDTSHGINTSASYYPKFVQPKGVLAFYSTAVPVDGTSGGDGSSLGTWTDVSARNYTNTTVIAGGAVDTVYSLETTGSDATNAPDNFLLVAKNKKFNKIHFNLDNDIGPDEIRKDTTTNTASLRVWYSTASGWKPLDFRDTTAVEKNQSLPYSLATSGSITFDMPLDWEPVTAKDVSIGTGTDPVDLDIKYASGTASGGSTTTLADSGVLDQADDYWNGHTVEFLAGDNSGIISGTASGGSTTTLVDSGVLDQADNFWIGKTVKFTAGANAGKTAYITDSSNSGTSITFAKQSTAIDSSTEYQIDGGINSAVITDFATSGDTMTFATQDTAISDNTQYRIRGTDDPIHSWNFDGYGILVGISVKTTPTAIKVMRAHVCNNSHSQIVTVKDPTHVSINHIPISQSISYNRGGTFHRIEDRLGKAEIRKIRASGGNLTFGGIDLGNGDKNTIEEHHRYNVPVYLDIKHRAGDYTRFYGVITNLSLDNPTGNMFAKFAIQLATTHIIEFTSGGVWTKRTSLGGDIADEPKFIF